MQISDGTFLHFIILFSQGLSKLSALVTGDQLDSWKQPGPIYIFNFCFKDYISSANNNEKSCVYKSKFCEVLCSPCAKHGKCKSWRVWILMMKKKYPTGNNFSRSKFENQIKGFFPHYFVMNIMLFFSCKGWNKEREYSRRSSEFNRLRRVCVCKTNKPLQNRTSYSETDHRVLTNTLLYQNGASFSKDAIFTLGKQEDRQQTPPTSILEAKILVQMQPVFQFAVGSRHSSHHPSPCLCLLALFVGKVLLLSQDVQVQQETGSYQFP